MFLPLSLLTFYLAAAHGGTVNIARQYGALSAYINQTSRGYFRMVKGDQDVFRVPSVWMQDDANKRMRIDVGARGQPGFQTEFYFLGNEAYELMQRSNGSYYCKRVVDFGYDNEIGTYGPTNFGFVGRHVLQEFNNKVADVYAGQALDGVGPMNVVFYMTPSGREFMGMIITGNLGKSQFLEYWYGDDSSSTPPPSYVFQLPQECMNPAETVRFFDEFNSDGTKKEKKANLVFGTSSASSSNDDLCAGPAPQGDYASLVYKAVCCNLKSLIGMGK